MQFPKWIKNLPSEQHLFLSHHLQANQCDIYFSELNARTFNPNHEHDQTVLNFVAQGQITVEQNGKKQTYKVGDWCEIPKGVTHSLLADTESRLIEFWLK